MNRKSVFVTLFLLAIIAGAVAQEEGDQPRNYLGVNIAHPLIIFGISRLLSDTTAYLPIHLHYALRLGENWGLGSQFLYQLEMDGRHFSTNEFGLAVGPRFSINVGKGSTVYFIQCKVGAGYAFGTDYNNNAYSRLDLIVEPDTGFTFVLGKVFALTAGIGLQSLIPLTESPQRSSSPGGWWDWNEIGYLSHYFLPVANVSLGFVF
jgi:hypothetical protein